MSVGLTRARGARGFEGDPAGANPSVGGHEHQRVPPLGESLRPRIVRERAGLERSGVGRQCGRPWRRSARWRMASSVHLKRTICSRSGSSHVPVANPLRNDENHAARWAQPSRVPVEPIHHRTRTHSQRVRSGRLERPIQSDLPFAQREIAMGAKEQAPTESGAQA